MDADGLCNAYVVVTCAGHAGHTRNDHSIVPSCDPQWYETVTIELPLPQPVPLNTEILVRVYDKDSEEEGPGSLRLGLPIMLQEPVVQVGM